MMTQAERRALRDEHRKTMDARMKERGIEPGPRHAQGRGPQGPGGPGAAKGSGPRGTSRARGVCPDDLDENLRRYCEKMGESPQG